MKKTLTIVGILLIVFSTISTINVTRGHSGAGLYGMLTFYVITLLIGGSLIYFGTKKNVSSSEKVTSKIDNKLQKLKDLYNDGYLTSDEYYEKTTKIKSEKLQKSLKQTTEYKKLKSLYDDGILTREEFESKIRILKNKTIFKEDTSIKRQGSVN